MWRSTYARLPAATHPRIAETAPLLAARMVESAYPTALDMLLASAERDLAGLQVSGAEPRPPRP